MFSIRTKSLQSLSKKCVQAKKNLKFHRWGEIVTYDESCPSKLKWIVDRANQIKKGQPTGTFNKNLGYWMFSSNIFGKSRMYYCHRIIWELFNGPIPDGMQIDHIDMDRSNNTLSNLRLVSRKKNLRNSNMNPRNTSGITGVYETESGWIAHWVDLQGNKKSMYFSKKKLTNQGARQAAIDLRKFQIESMNKEGAGYTTSHGLKRKEIK